MSVSPNNTVANTGLKITNNVVFASANFFAAGGSGAVAAPYFKSNQFTATNIASDLDHARMFILRDIPNVTLDSNIDRTTPGIGYHSRSLQGSTTLAVNTNNTFVP
jgi:hypothetical protein